MAPETDNDASIRGMIESSKTLTRALALHRAGRLSEAEAEYRQALAEEPGNPDALHFLGLAAYQSARHKEALELIRRAIATRPHPTFWYNLAQVHLALGDAPAAEEALRQTLAKAPGHAEALFHLGNMHRARREVAAAIDCYRRALAAKPGLVDAHINLALLQKDAGETAEAISHLETADRLRPNDPEILNNLGIVHRDISPERAIEDFRRALDLDPRFSDAAANLAKLFFSLVRYDEAIEVLSAILRIEDENVGLRMLMASILAEGDRTSEAIAHYEKAAEAKSQSARPLVAQGNLHKRLGQFEKASSCYQRALALDPDETDALAAIVAHLKSHAPEHQIARAAECADDPMLSSERRRNLHFALSQCRESAGDYDAAFHHLNEGNALRRSELEQDGGPYDAGKETARVSDAIEIFNADYFRRVATFGIASELPVFIVGMPRSGTTLCEQILASHSQIFGADELPDIGRIERELIQQIGEGSRRGYAAHLTGNVVYAFAERYLERLRALSPNARRITDKMPMNYHRLGLIATLFPHARIIHCQRDPLDMGLSCYSKNLVSMALWVSDLAAIGHVYREYERLMAHWRRVLPIPMLEIPYESVVHDVEGSARLLVEYCGLEWEESCLEFYRAERQVKTASLEQVRQPIYSSSVGRWKRFERHLAPLRDALNKHAG